MSVPDWWSTILLVAAAFRVWHLLAHDSIFDYPRRRILRIAETWEKEGDDPGDDYRLEWGLFLNCPYCAGFWIGLLWFGAWEISHFWTEVAAMPWAISAGIIALSKVLTQPSD